MYYRDLEGLDMQECQLGKLVKTLSKGKVVEDPKLAGDARYRQHQCKEQAFVSMNPGVNELQPASMKLQSTQVLWSLCSRLSQEII